MQERLKQFLHAENITPSQFADYLGVQRSGVSHILAGRNKPGFEFIERMLHRYPALNADWLITGKGKMYKNPLSPDGGSSPSAEQIPGATAGPSSETGSLFNDIPAEPKTIIDSNIEAFDNPPTQKVLVQNLPQPEKETKSSSAIQKIIVLYTDNTFVEYRPQ